MKRKKKSWLFLVTKYKLLWREVSNFISWPSKRWSELGFSTHLSFSSVSPAFWDSVCPPGKGLLNDGVYSTLLASKIFPKSQLVPWLNDFLVTISWIPFHKWITEAKKQIVNKVAQLASGRARVWTRMCPTPESFIGPSDMGHNDFK